MLPRTLLHIFISTYLKNKQPLHAVTTAKFRVWPTDLDVLLHMNNGKYLSILDIARFEYIVRTGLHRMMQRNNWYTVIGSQTISYRKSLEPFQKFQVETKLVALDERACYIEQRFVRHGEIYAKAFIKARVLRKQGPPVTMAELCQEINLDPAEYPLPEQLDEWQTMMRLPSTRSAAPSVWDA